MPALIVKHGPNSGQRYEIDGELVVGRENAGLTIADSEMSRKHAVIRPRADALEIEDLGSLNGTFVNGAKIEGATRISGGDTIKIGTTTLEVEPVPSRASDTAPSARAPAETAVAPSPPRVPAPAPPPPAAAAPAPVAAAPPQAPEPAPRPPAAAPREKPTEAFGAFVEPSSATRGRVASRVFGPTFVSWISVISTAVALGLYFSQR